MDFIWKLYILLSSFLMVTLVQFLKPHTTSPLVLVDVGRIQKLTLSLVGLVLQISL